MLWWEHYNNEFTSKAQLKLKHHLGEGLGHHSNIGVIDVLDFFRGLKLSNTFRILGFRSVRVDGLALTGLTSWLISHLLMN